MYDILYIYVTMMLTAKALVVLSVFNRKKAYHAEIIFKFLSGLMHHRNTSMYEEISA